MNISHYQLDIDTPSIKQSWPLTTALAAQIPPMKTCPCTWAVYTSRITSAILGRQIVEEKIGTLNHLILLKHGTLGYNCHQNLQILLQDL